MSDASKTAISDAEIDAAVESIVAAFHPKMEAAVHKYCDEAYSAILEIVDDYLRQNAASNFKAHVASYEREANNLRRCLSAAKDSIDMIEMGENVYAGAGGYWLESRADEYRAKALDRQSSLKAKDQPHD